jgi:Family of unknown function (DUF5670)
MLWTLLVVLLIIWLVANLMSGFAMPLLHLLLVIAAIVLIFQLLTGRRAV